jgi:hypothetical protein
MGVTSIRLNADVEVPKSILHARRWTMLAGRIL